MTTPTRTNPWGALAALCTGFFLIMMDTTIVTVAVPDMIEQLHTDLNGITWVTSIYLLAYAVPLLITGRLGDRWGRKPVFLAGMAVFTVASLWCGLAGSIESLIAARALQGIGAAIMAPQTMAFISTLFPADRRGKALGVWGAVAGLATTVGPLLGGLLVPLGWHWIFLVNVPIGLAGLALTWRLVPGGQERHSRRFDFVGTVLCGLGLLALVFGVQNGEVYHWGAVVGPITVTHLIGAGVLLLVAFLLWQRRAAEPLMPLALFGHRNFSAAAAAAGAVGFALTAFYLPLTLFLQSVMKLSPPEAGALMVPIAVGAAVTGPMSGTLSDRMAGKWVVLNGFAIFTLGIAAVSVDVSPDANLWRVGAALAVCGMGTGTAFAPMANVAMGGLPVHLLGAASGTYNITRQVGSVVGSALVSLLLQAQLAGGDAQGAIATAFLLPVAVMLLGCAACFAMRAPRTTTRQPRITTPQSRTTTPQSPTTQQSPSRPREAVAIGSER
jgi:EmrB/QacA subfamily drug resistance transporter